MDTVQKMVKRHALRSSGASLKGKPKTMKRSSKASLPERFLPKKHLPQWHDYRLDEKLPLGPYKDSGLIHLTRNTLANGNVESGRGAAFDTRLLPKELLTYKAENDPHLKGYLNEPHVKKHLRKMGIINERDEVPCSVKEYHAYRNFAQDLDKRIEKRQKELEEEFLLSKRPRSMSNRELEIEDHNRREKLRELKSKLVSQYAMIEESEQDVLEAQDRLKRRYEEAAFRPLHKISETDLQREIVKRRLKVEKRNTALRHLELWIKRLLEEYALDMATRNYEKEKMQEKLDEEYELKKMVQNKIAGEKELHNRIKSQQRKEKLEKRIADQKARYEAEEGRKNREKEEMNQLNESRENFFVQKLARKILQKKLEHDERDKKLRRMGPIEAEEMKKIPTQVSESSVMSVDIDAALEQTFSLNWHPKHVINAFKEKYFQKALVWETTEESLKRAELVAMKASADVVKEFLEYSLIEENQDNADTASNEDEIVADSTNGSVDAQAEMSKTDETNIKKSEAVKKTSQQGEDSQNVISSKTSVGKMSSNQLSQTKTNNNSNQTNNARVERRKNINIFVPTLNNATNKRARQHLSRLSQVGQLFMQNI